ncbi:MAG: hypothetical protein HY779_01760 [Rubrobacteridae bacterium]|nr:hypothetical protein [Rubrobacteridae bacterium]
MSKINKKRPIYVLDTNVLLYNPRAVYAFPDADVIIPDTVLMELDKIKTSRADRELRYRGREISRILFDLTDGAGQDKDIASRQRTQIPGSRNIADPIRSIG